MKIFRVCIYILLCQLAASANMLGAGLNTNLKSLKANFEQIISAEGGLEASYYGVLYAKMPNKAKWDYSPPMDKQVFINNGKFAVYEPSLMQAYIGLVQGSSDFFEILSNATPELDSHNKQTGRYIARVDGIEYTLAIDKNGLPISIQYTDQLGSPTKIIFNNVIANPTLQDSLFIFTPPKDIDVILQK